MARDHASPTVMGGLLALALLMAFWPGGALAQEVEACNDEPTELVLRQGAVVGHINVCNDDEELTVTIQMLTPWFLCKADVHAATTPEDGEKDDNIPQDRNGVPNPGEFADGADYDPCVPEDTFPIPLADIDGGVELGEEVAIAVHAEVFDDLSERKEGAWSQGTPFDPEGRRTWAMYFTYEVQAASCDQPEGSCRVFVTSGQFTGDLFTAAGVLTQTTPEDGLDAGDRICQFLADDASLGGTYKAWLSASGAGNAAAERLNHSTVPYVLVGGERVADDWDDLTTCDGAVGECLQRPIDRTEGDDTPPLDNANPPIVETWTGTTPTGSVDVAERTCQGWETALAVPGRQGNAVDDTGNWTSVHTSACNAAARLYCFEQ